MKTPCYRVVCAVNEGKIRRYQQGEIPVFIGLEGRTAPHEGTINFVNNQVNPGTRRKHHGPRSAAKSDAGRMVCGYYRRGCS